MLDAYSTKPAPDEITIKSILYEDLRQLLPKYSRSKIIHQILDAYGLDNIGSMTCWNVYAR